VTHVSGTLLFLLSGGRPPTEFPQKRLKIDFRDKVGGAWLGSQDVVTPRAAQVRMGDRLANFLGKLLEPAPEDRFDSASEALAALTNPVSSLKARGWLAVVSKIAIFSLPLRPMHVPNQVV
jgi:hypothetical protein